VAEKQIESILELVVALPELYQPIYGYPELSGKASRFCLDRRDSILNCYRALKNLLGRDLRVLDLGCAQGFFSFTLAELGASVDAIDYCKENIDLCNAIAARNSNLKVSFQVSRLEDKIGSLSHEEYDIILGLSVLHHVIHEHGQEFVKDLAHKISDASRVVILELALQEEPIYWGKSQPANPKSILEGIAFVHQLSKHKTHLSEVERPLIVASNSIWILDGLADKFDTCTDKPHAFAQNTHEGSRRYFFSQNLLLKHYQLKGAREEINNQEFSNEKEFLSKKHKGFKTPRVITIGSNENEGWVILKKVSGRLLLDVLLEKQKIDPLNLVLAVLKQLVALESFGLYHNDVRCWNILVTENGNPCIIDYGSISSEKKDAVWPDDLILAFLIFVHELVTGIIGDPLVSRTFAISPARLPEPYQTWALGFWNKKDAPVTFQYLYDSLLCISKKSHILIKSELSPHDFWYKSIEDAVEECRVKSWQLNEALKHQAYKMLKAEEHLISESATIHTLSSDLSTLRSESEVSRAEYLAAQSNLVSVGFERGQLAERVTALESERSTLSSDNASLLNSNSLLATEREALQHQLHEIHQANHGHWQLAESLKQELAAKEKTWSEERLTLDSRLSTLDAERNELATRHQLLVIERAALASRIEEVAGEAAVARAQSESLRQELRAKDESLVAMRETLAAERAAAEARHQQLTSEKNYLDALFLTLSSENNALEREHKQVKIRVEEMAGEAAVARAQSESLRQELAANEQAWSEERSTLDSRLSALLAERDTLATSNSSLSTERNALSARLSALLAERDTLATERDELATRYQSLATSHSTLVSEHEALHQANHGHWQLAESLKQELAAKEQAWSHERSALSSDNSSLVTSNSLLATEREALSARLSSLLAQREALATSNSLLVTERNALLASTCWRITAPIRWVRGGVRIPWPAPNEPLDDFFLKHAALYIRRRPHLKERALRFLFQNPKWHARVLPVLQGIKVSTPSPQASQPIPQPVQLLQPAPLPAPLLEVFPPHEPLAEIPSPPSEECFVAHSIQVAKSPPLPLIAAARPKILQLTNYSIEEPDHGGKLRCYNIREALREYFEVKTLSIEVSENDTVDDHSIGVCAKDLYAQIGDGCLQDWASAYYLIEKQNLWSSLRQIVLNFNPDAILLEQPFLFPVFKKLQQDGALRKECILINSSQNNEVELKRGIYNQIFGKQKAVEKLDIVKQLESEATRAAHLSIAVSEQDLDYLKALSPDQPVLLYRNGHSGIKTTREIQKWAEKFANSERNFIVVGSWHMPNILGLKRLVDAGLLSLDPKKTKLWVFGGMGPGLLSTFSLTLGESSPLEIIGQASSDDIDSAIMASSGVILPIWDGSGSNLKTAQALLSGKTIIGTNFAFRGFEAHSTESGVNITDDADALLGAMRSVDISANHQRPQAVAHLRWDNLLKNLPQDVANVMGYPIERYKVASALFFDITTLVRWKGHPTGIARVISNLGSAMLSACPELQFTIFSSESGNFHHYDINQNQQGGAIDISSQDIIFSAGANWDDEGFEDAIFKAKQRGAQYSLLFYDAIPYLLPHSFGPGFADRFIPWLKKSIQLSDINFAISKNTRQDFIEFANAKSIKIAETTVIRLGDSMKSSHEMNQNSENEEKIRHREFILCVGTLEFRKNHIVLLNAYRLLLQSGVSNIPQLIIVGCQGWMDSDISIQVQNDKLIHGYIQVLSGVSDSELTNLYRDCLFTVYPALYEGWGLPVSESLGYGKICITSRSSSMVEIAPHLTPFANPLAPEEWAEQISRLINNRELLAKESAKIASEYKLTKWAATAASVLKSLETFSLACHK
jgi:O-antigen chain-terminating methyltransferase